MRSNLLVLTGIVLGVFPPGILTAQDTTAGPLCPGNNQDFVREALTLGLRPIADSVGTLPSALRLVVEADPALTTPLLETLTAFCRERGCAAPHWSTPGDTVAAASPALILRVRRLGFSYPGRVGGSVFGGGALQRRVEGEVLLYLEESGRTRGPFTCNVLQEGEVPMSCRSEVERDLPVFYTPSWEPKGWVEVLLEPLLISGVVAGLLYLLYTSR